jgi:hypothetical protein
MRTLVILGGLTFIGGAFGFAVVQAVLDHDVMRATALVGAGLFSIPLAAAIKV